MTQKHTPGLWTSDEYGHTSFAADKYPDDYFMRIEWHKDMSDEERNATGCLIAAAPELLKALIESHEALRDIIGAADNKQPYTAQELADEFIKICDANEAAIAKATGEA